MSPLSAGATIAAIPLLDEGIRKLPKGRFEFTTGLGPHLIQVLREEGAKDLAAQLRSGNRRTLQYGLARLERVLQAGGNRPLRDRVGRLFRWYAEDAARAVTPPEPQHRERLPTGRQLALFPVPRGKGPDAKPKKPPEPKPPVQLDWITLSRKALPTHSPFPIQVPLILAGAAKVIPSIHLGGPVGIVAKPSGRLAQFQLPLKLPRTRRPSSFRMAFNGLPVADIDERETLPHVAIPGGGNGSGVLKRLGAKSKLLPLWDQPGHPWIPRVLLDMFVEPFGGSLAVPFFLSLTGRIGPDTHLIINEIHPQLFAVYEAIRKDVERLIGILRRFKEDRSEEQFYRMRAEFNTDLDLGRNRDPIYTGARFLYLSASCFGSIARQNSFSGHINVKYRKDGNKIAIFSERNLRRMAEILQYATLIHGNFLEVLPFVERENPARAWAYMDPPYWGQSTEVEYGVPLFTPEMQQQVALLLRWFYERGIWASVSNSDHPFVRTILRDAPVLESFGVPDALSSASGRAQQNGGAVRQVRPEIFASNFVMPWMLGVETYSARWRKMGLAPRVGYF